MFKKAIVRIPGSNFANGLTTSTLGKPDFDKILNQHKNYIEILKQLGLEIVELPSEHHYPDAYFVEDTAVVLNEAAIITRPGAKARRGEKDSIKPVVKKYKKIELIEAPGTVDGGDVLQVDKIFYIGLTERTNLEGAGQFKTIVEKYGYKCKFIEVGKGLHLKSSVNYIGWNTVLITSALSENSEFDKYNKIVLEEADEYAANTLLINETLITPSGFPNVKKELEKITDNIIEIDVSEVRKMDGGLTCMSLRF